ncbi:MAG: hypothetical protein VX484_06305, partial [Chloroflexota bacterium]|nr:hypothetical protein [Chloroflexota bacterium]
FYIRFCPESHFIDFSTIPSSQFLYWPHAKLIAKILAIGFLQNSEPCLSFLALFLGQRCAGGEGDRIEK